VDLFDLFHIHYVVYPTKDSYQFMLKGTLSRCASGRGGAAALHTSGGALLKRFVPPWEREGEPPANFFEGILSSRNPYVKHKRDQRRRDDELTAHEEEMALTEAAEEEELKAHANLENIRQEVEEGDREFLPYGATPLKYFSKDGMAAWGSYSAQVSRANQQALASQKALAKEVNGGMYTGDDTCRRLAADMDVQIPYKHDTTPGKKVGNGTWPLHGSMGVVLDIDGVVYRSKEVIPGSDTAIRQMQKLKIPFMFMTNGGGVTEKMKAEELTAILKLDEPITEEQICLSHTPMRLLVEKFKHDPIVVAGAGSCKDVALSYGFTDVKPILELQAEHPELVPFKQWGKESPATQALYNATMESRRGKPGGGISQSGLLTGDPIEAVLVMDVLEDTYNDIQVILDICTSPMGMVGNDYVSRSQSVPIYWCADDLVWSTNARLPRLGGGAFREMLATTYSSVTGSELEVTCYGKPRAIAYAYCEKQLAIQASKLGWDPAEMRTIAMVGDNLETDIIGANARGGKWLSVHVLSGIGHSPAARRTVSPGDDELDWLLRYPHSSPHYIAPTFDHFLREAMCFGEVMVTGNKAAYYGMPSPADLPGQYCFKQ
jgi:HAD superfamily hydrolase (TIGR01456 family)